MPQGEAEGEFYRLNEHYLGLLNARERGWPKRDQFKRYYRDIKRSKGSIERLWKPLTLGEAIPRLMAEVFTDYLRERMGYEDASSRRRSCKACRRKTSVCSETCRIRSSAV